MVLAPPMINKPTLQGRRRVFKSGSAEETIEFRRHERGRAREGGLLFLYLARFGGSPPINFFENLSASMCVINVCFMHLLPDFSHDFLLEKIFFGELETES